MPILAWIHSSIEDGWERFVLISFLSVIVTLIAIIFVGINKKEKQLLQSFIKGRNL